MSRARPVDDLASLIGDAEANSNLGSAGSAPVALGRIGETAAEAAAREAGPSAAGAGAGAALTWANFICHSAHPGAALAHLVFKGAAFGVYLSGGGALGYVQAFVLVVLFAAADFWAVKNVTGRRLVGLRWWVRIRADGTNEWLFESAAPGATPPSPLDVRIFWWATYGAPVVWLALAALASLRFSLDWVLVAAVGAGLSGANTYGYFRCSSDAASRQRLRATLASGAMVGLAYLPSSAGQAAAAIGSSMLSAFAAAPPAPTEKV